MNATLSKTISWLRFPLAALIVLKHYYTPDISAEAVGGADELMVYHYIGEFTKGVFPAIAVPLFFFISGYLYFNKLELTGTQGYSFSIWKKKTQGRIKSLLIPYLSWNLLVLALYYITQCLTGGSDVMTKDGYKLIADYGIADYAKAVYAIDSTGMPIDGPLWFIRDLFIVSVFITPPHLAHNQIFKSVWNDPSHRIVPNGSIYPSAGTQQCCHLLFRLGRLHEPAQNQHGC